MESLLRTLCAHGAPEPIVVRGSRRKSALISLRISGLRRFFLRTLALTLPLSALGDDSKTPSYYHDLVPILKRSCTGCHHPGKLKGELDLTTYASFLKGGKHGASFQAAKPEESRVIEEISGEEPNMPKEGDPLTKEEVALFQRWIKEGAKDDTPPEADSFKRDDSVKKSLEMSRLIDDALAADRRSAETAEPESSSSETADPPAADRP